ncbi:MAG: Jag N-terminal domain-containing protein [Acidimicrobiia bacterium]|nr:Jag N-terminal domain-containing protein [Acidimicrobiia bacterium]
MEWVEVTGRTVEEAKESALDQLGVDEHDAEFEIVEEPKSGLFGRLRSEARVRARVVPTSPRPKVERRERRGRGSRERRPGSGSSGAAGGQRSEARSGGQRNEARSSGRRGQTVTTEQPEAQVEPPSLAQEAEVAEEFLQGLLAAFKLEGQVGSEELDEDTVEVSVSGQDLGLLIGPKGQTLGAVQDITRTVVQRKLGARSGRLLVDVAEYRKARRAALERFATGVAAKVKDAGVPTALEPMNPADRKVVHDTVNGIDGVTTTSEGEEPTRRVVILPEGQTAD